VNQGLDAVQFFSKDAEVVTHTSNQLIDLVHKSIHATYRQNSFLLKYTVILLIIICFSTELPNRTLPAWHDR